MRNYIFAQILLISLLIPTALFCQTNDSAKSDLTLVFIRHAEKPQKGDNLTCKGFNRSIKLPNVIISKFGVPDFLYVPTLKMGTKTSHSRMFETIIPLAVKYNLAINTKFDEKDISGLAAEIKAEKGTVLVVWEHSVTAGILHELGINDDLKWASDDYDSIWIVKFVDGKAVFTKGNEGLNLSSECE